MTRRNFKVSDLAAARRPRRKRAPAGGPVTVMRADPRVMRAALRTAGGDAARIEIQPDGSVVVRNSARSARHTQPAQRH